jgi:hypothetical protein
MGLLAACGGDPAGTGGSGGSGAGGAGAGGTGAGGATGGTGGTGTGGTGGGEFGEGVTVHVARVADGPQTLSFGVPVPKGVLAEVSKARFRIGGKAVEASTKELLAEHDKDGKRVGVRALLVQLPASVLEGDAVDVAIAWSGDGAAPGTTIVPFADDGVSFDSAVSATTTVRTIAQQNGSYVLQEAPPETKTLFSGREPRAVATFPEGYLAQTGILGEQVTASFAAGPDRAGIAYLSEALRGFGLSGMYAETYALNPDPESVVDPVVNYEGWLYDRCATFLTAYLHHGDVRFLRHALQNCSYFARKVNTAGPDPGIFSGKPDPDPKYSHLRGLYAYYALTGDETALAAGKAIAEMWLAEPGFVLPYRAGHTGGPDKLWTERLLGTSLEGLYYGHRLTGDVKYLEAFAEVLKTAYLHVTGDAAGLAQINPGFDFPPQNCFIHSGEQHSDAGPADPWCSSWMSELVVEPLLRYQEQTGDERVDEIFVRLARFLRDTGSGYFTSDLNDDSFLSPGVCDDPGDAENRRRLVPLYGSGLDKSGVRHNFGEYDDFEHCADATALTAAAIRALTRQGKLGDNPVPPFASEGESFVQLFHEFSSCAERVFAEDTRPHRDPATWTSADLAAGAADPAAFILQNKIGFPSHPSAPQRKLSWWFNSSMLQYGLLADASLDVPMLAPGKVPGPGCP